MLASRYFGLMIARTPATPTDAPLIAELIERLARLVRAERHAAGLNPAQWDALTYLARCNRYSNTPGAVARFLNATKGTASQTLNALERKHLLQRRPDPESGRIVRLFLTPRGETLAARDPMQELTATATTLPATQREAMLQGLAAMLTQLQRGRGDRPFGVCHTCRHFRTGAKGERTHWCTLLEQTLQDSDSTRLCAEHEPA